VETVADALDHLADGPTWFVGDTLRDGARQLGSVSRSDAVKVMIELGDATMGPEATPAQDS
jgi:hypothetical protein